METVCAQCKRNDIFAACVNEHPECVNAWILFGRNVNKTYTHTNGRQHTPLDIAVVEKPSLEIAKLLVDGGAKVTLNHLQAACNANNLPLCEAIMRKESISSHGAALLTSIIPRMNNMDIYNVLVKCDIAPGVEHMTQACQLGKIDFVRVFLTVEALKQPAVLTTALDTAIFNNHVAVVALLMQNVADKDTCLVKGENALFWMCKSRRVDMVKVWKEGGGNLNLVVNGESALRIACEVSDSALVKVLLEGGAKHHERKLASKHPIDLKNHQRNLTKQVETSTPLALAISTNNVEILKLLLEHRVVDLKSLRMRSSQRNFNSGDEALSTLTPFAYALERKFYPLLKLLRTADIDVNAVSATGNSILAEAVVNASVEGVRVMIELEVNPMLTNKNGDSAMDVTCDAIMNPHNNVAAFTTIQNMLFEYISQRHQTDMLK